MFCKKRSYVFKKRSYVFVHRQTTSPTPYPSTLKKMKENSLFKSFTFKNIRTKKILIRIIIIFVSVIEECKKNYIKNR